MQRAPLDGFHTNHDSPSWNSLLANERGGKNLEEDATRLALEGLIQGGETERERERDRERERERETEGW